MNILATDETQMKHGFLTQRTQRLTQRGIHFLLCVLCVLIIAGVLAGCNVAGVPDWKGNSKKYLLENGYSQDVVDAFLEYKPLAPDVIERLIHAPSQAIRLMLAENPHLTFAERQVMSQDEDAYVRCALARNLRLSHEEMLAIIQAQSKYDTAFDKVFVTRRSKSNVFLEGLARNPAASREILLQVFDIFQKRGHNRYSPFAMNPNCPQEIIDVIMSKSNSLKPFGSMEQDWVRRTQGQKEQLRQLKAKGEPFPGGYLPWGFADLWWRDEGDGE